MFPGFDEYGIGGQAGDGAGAEDASPAEWVGLLTINQRRLDLPLLRKRRETQCAYPESVVFQSEAGLRTLLENLRCGHIVDGIEVADRRQTERCASGAMPGCGRESCGQAQRPPSIQGRIVLMATLEQHGKLRAASSSR